MSTSEPPQTRRLIMKVYVTEIEHHRITELAGAARLPASVYLRTLGQGWTPRSTLDHQTALALLKVNADQGRLGGLLKLWLSERPGQGASVADVRRVLRDIEATQEALRQFVRRL